VRELTPRQIVEELARYIVGQDKAKRAVAIAIRNRWRRQQLAPELREEVAPKNIIMIGPTGVGKTEIARRLANLVNAPFLKVEASRYTEVGYHGRDVESMIRDLVELAVETVRGEQLEGVQDQAKEHAEERLLDILLPAPAEGEPPRESTRERLRAKLRAGGFDARTIELDVKEQPSVIPVFASMGMDQVDMNLQNMLERIMPTRHRPRRVTVREAFRILAQEEAEKLIDREQVTEEALQRAQDSGIVFLDELDKIAGREARAAGPDVSREGVQRDLLPIIEGSTVATRHGMVRTDHILFIAAGAFHVAKPADLIPEMQGRFPIRVELDELGKDEFVRILTEPQNALTKQYAALMETEGVKLTFSPEAVDEIATMAYHINQRTQSIGARRLHTVMERLLEDISFDAPEMGGAKVPIDAKYVRDKLKDIVADEDLARFIL